MKILVTGCAGFIGFHLSKKLLAKGDTVIGVDNLNEYYDPSLKESRLKILNESPNFEFHKLDISEGLDSLKDKGIEIICNLAAQAGVRYSIENPLAYQKANSLGMLQLLEFARQNKIPKVVYASSSSVYGDSENAPFKETDKPDEPISLYAATKRSNELYAHVYSHLFGIKTIGLRFFTVYGPYGRPDMAIFKFTKSILDEQPIDVYNEGKMKRDFTYVDDIVLGILGAIESEKTSNYEIINIARGESVELMDFIKAIEEATGKKAKLNLMPMQPGDVLLTSGDITKAKEKLNYAPQTSVKEGVKKFVDWYKEYYGK